MQVNLRTALRILVMAFTIKSTFLQAQSRNIITTQRISPVGVISYPESVQFDNFDANSHIDGYVKKYGGKQFVFPVGDQSAYRPFAAAADQTIGAYYFVNPNEANSTISFPGGPFLTTNKESSIGMVSGYEFWDIRIQSPTQITISWNQRSNLVELLQPHAGALAKLSVVGWDGSKWVKLSSTIDPNPITGGTSTISSGSITTTDPVLPDHFRIFTLGSEAVTALPVALARFSGQIVEQHAHLQWTTTFEENASHFEVEKSNNMMQWKYLDRVNALNKQGYSSISGNINYTFKDTAGLYSENYYRLKIVDYDGTYTYSKIQYLRYAGDGSFVVYPNPSYDRIFIRGKDRIASVNIYNSTGVKMLTFHSLNEEGLDIQGLNSGIHVIELIDKNNVRTTRNLVVSR